MTVKYYALSVFAEQLVSVSLGYVHNITEVQYKAYNPDCIIHNIPKICTRFELCFL